MEFCTSCILRSLSASARKYMYTAPSDRTETRGKQESKSFLTPESISKKERKKSQIVKNEKRSSPGSWCLKTKEHHVGIGEMYIGKISVKFWSVTGKRMCCIQRI